MGAGRLADACRAGVFDAMRSWRALEFLVLMAVATGCLAPAAFSQAVTTSVSSATNAAASVKSVCSDSAINSAASTALRMVCERPPSTHPSPRAATPLIVIGFVGGFVKPDDFRHPEPLFALYLRQQYGDAVYARAFSNHDAKGAHNYLLQLLDANHDGIVSKDERENARIVLYGHSWGASETAAFARQLGRVGIPVLLTVQLDIITKPGQKPAIIAPNVAKAINFYQPNGPLHGRPLIVASNPAATTILGNIQMTYGHSHVNCRNYSWFVRTFNRPHHEIENDARVWDQVASLIDAEVQKPQSAVLTREPQGSEQVIAQESSTGP
jgi:pimeloyl-ACP methyl ester carboxylesterase